MTEPEIPQSIANSFGFRLSGNNSWTIKESAQQCIVDKMNIRGMRDGKVDIESPRRDTSYRFDFFPSPLHRKPVSYRIYYSGSGLTLSVDMSDVVRKDAEWGGEDDPEEIRRLNLFIGSINDCIKKSIEPMKPVSDKPEEVKPSPYGYAEESGLENIFGKMKVGGRKKTRRQKKRRATQKRKTDLHNRRR